MDRTNVIKLDLKKSNYNEWKTQIIGALKAASVYSQIKQKRMRPTDIALQPSWDKDEEKAQGIF
jgi:hypothetical protein